MTRRDNRTRLWLYVGISITAYVPTAIVAVDFASWKQVVAFGCSVIGTGLITARTYLDKSPAEAAKAADRAAGPPPVP